MTANESAKSIFILSGSFCLFLAPLLTFIGWVLPHDSLSSFFQFTLSRETTDATGLIDRTNLDQVFRYYLLPHYFIYASMPFYVGAGIYLAFLSFKKNPWHAFVGSVLIVIGAIYFIGVLGAYLSIPIGTINQTNILKISFVLSALLYVGNLILGFGILQSQILPKGNTLLFIFGVMLIIIFPGIENWMALGSLFILIGLYPLSISTLRSP